MNKESEILKAMDILINDLTPNQLEGLKKFAERIENPNNMDVNQVMGIVNELGLDIDKLRKKAKKICIKPKIGVNTKCPCDSGKKYKKCCMNKLPLS